jgi:hypothetical protein
VAFFGYLLLLLTEGNKKKEQSKKHTEILFLLYHSPLFSLTPQAQIEKLSKEKRRKGSFAVCGQRQGLRALDCAAF